jgi:hypothetical protein
MRIDPLGERGGSPSSPAGIGQRAMAGAMAAGGAPAEG